MILVLANIIPNSHSYLADQLQFAIEFVASGLMDSLSMIKLEVLSDNQFIITTTFHLITSSQLFFTFFSLYRDMNSLSKFNSFGLFYDHDHDYCT